MIRRCTTIALLALLPLAPAAAETLDVAIGDSTVRMGLSGPLPQLNTEASAQYDLGGVYRDERGGDAFVPHVGVMLTGDTGARDVRMTAGLGLRLAYIDGENDDGGVLALGGQVDVRLPGLERIALTAHAFGAPEATAFGDIEDYYDVGLSLGYEVVRGAWAYVAVREVRADVDPRGKIEADEGLFGGLRLNF